MGADVSGSGSRIDNHELKTNAFFNLASGSFFSFTNDLALETSSGSTYAQANRNRILSDAIPCLTLPLGSNHDTNLDLNLEAREILICRAITKMVGLLVVGWTIPDRHYIW